MGLNILKKSMPKAALDSIFGSMNMVLEGCEYHFFRAVIRANITPITT
jgi:hypothetical protein